MTNPGSDLQAWLYCQLLVSFCIHVDETNSFCLLLSSLIDQYRFCSMVIWGFSLLFSRFVTESGESSKISEVSYTDLVLAQLLRGCFCCLFCRRTYKQSLRKTHVKDGHWLYQTSSLFSDSFQILYQKYILRMPWCYSRLLPLVAESCILLGVVYFLCICCRKWRTLMMGESVNSGLSVPHSSGNGHATIDWEFHALEVMRLLSIFQTSEPISFTESRESWPSHPSSNLRPTMKRSP